MRKLSDEEIIAYARDKDIRAMSASSFLAGWRACERYVRESCAQCEGRGLTLFPAGMGPCPFCEKGREIEEHCRARTD